MSLSTRTIKVTYTAAGGTDFAFPDTPLVSDSAEVKVYLRDETTTPATVTLQTEGSANDYTLIGAPLPGQLNTTVRFNSAPTSGLKVVIHLELPLTQTLDLATGSGIPPESLELELDRAIGMIQQLQERVNRMPYLGVTEQIATADMELKQPAAAELIGWNATGDALTAYTPEAVALAAAGIVDTDDLNEGSTNLYFTNARADARITNAEVKTTKGDLGTRDASANARLAVGTNGQVLTADSAETLGIKWATPGTDNFEAISTLPDTLDAQNDVVVLSGASGTLNLPAATGSGKKYKIIHGGTSLTQVYTIDGNASETIRGVTTFLLHTNGQTVEIIDGASGAWTVLTHYTETPWTSFTMTIDGGTSAPTKATTTEIDAAFWRRVGDSLEMHYTYKHTNNAGTGAGSGSYIFQVPPNTSIDTSKITALGSDVNDALGVCGSSRADNNSASGPGDGAAQVFTSAGVVLSFNPEDATASVFVGSTAYAMTDATAMYSFRCTVPITNWEY